MNRLQQRRRPGEDDTTVNKTDTGQSDLKENRHKTIYTLRKQAKDDQTLKGTGAVQRQSK